MMVRCCAEGWREDADSRSFKVLHRPIFKLLAHAELTFIILANGESEIAPLPMVGDANLFLKGKPGDEDFEAEVGIMIAGISLSTFSDDVVHTKPPPTEEAYQRRGFAQEALRLMLTYTTGSPTSFSCPPLPATVPKPPSPFPILPESLVVRIAQDNVSSIKVFERLGFIETRGANAFGEKEMRFSKKVPVSTPMSS
jgi:hypothetical protein